MASYGLSAHAGSSLDLSTGASFSSGQYNETTSTDVLVVPLSIKFRTGHWTFKASTPYLHVKGPGSAAVVLDDSSGGSGSHGSGGSGGNTGSGSNSGSSGSGNSGSGSGSGSSGSGSSGSGSGGSGSGSGGSGSGSGGSGSGSGSGGSGSGSGGSGSGSGSGSGGSGSGSGSGGSSSASGATTFADDRSDSGIGDTTLSATYSFDRVGSESTYLDITGRVRLPTGDEDKGLGIGATDYGLSAEFGVDKPRGGAYVSAGRRFLGDADGLTREDGWQAGVGAWRHLTPRTSLGVGYDWRESSFAGGENPAEIYAYLNVKVSDAWRVNLSGAGGLNDASADYSVGVTVSWRAIDR